MGFALEDIKIVETAGVYAGPMASRLLADWGADVIHVEHPVRGDLIRAESGKRGGRVIMSDINYRLENFDRNKRGMTLDLSREDGQQVIYKLLEDADVFVSNFRPRELEKFKLEYATLSQLNPRLIFASITGQGRKGPDRDLPGYEFTSFFPRSGMLHLWQLPGTHPVHPPLGVGDNVSGMALACGIMAALYIRERTGVGQEVDVSLFQSGTYALSLHVAGSLVTGQDRQPVDRKDIANALLNPYRTKDGRWLFLGMSQQDPYWSRFCQAIERQDLENDPRFSSLELRTENHIALFQIMIEVFLGRTLAEWRERLNAAGIPWAPVQSLPDVTADPQARANDFFVSYDHPVYGRIEGVANPIKLSKTPATQRMPSPELGQHTEEILLEHGYTWDDIANLKEQGIIS